MTRANWVRHDGNSVLVRDQGKKTTSILRSDSSLWLFCPWKISAAEDLPWRFRTPCIGSSLRRYKPFSGNCGYCAVIWTEFPRKEHGRQFLRRNGYCPVLTRYTMGFAVVSWMLRQLMGRCRTRRQISWSRGGFLSGRSGQKPGALHRHLRLVPDESPSCACRSEDTRI